jgi:hypothetical protein
MGLRCKVCVGFKLFSRMVEDLFSFADSSELCCFLMLAFEEWAIKKIKPLSSLLVLFASL